mgnify:CR=1 FL=1
MLASGFVNRVTGPMDRSVSPPTEGQPYGEPGASLRRMAGLDRPANALDQSVDDRQPQPGSDAANTAVALVQRRSVERDAARSSSVKPGPPSRTSTTMWGDVAGCSTRPANTIRDRRRDAQQGVLEQTVQHLLHGGTHRPRR